MRVVTRHRPADVPGFVADAREALQVLSLQPGFLSGELGASPDDPSVLLLTTRWLNPGSMRRGMGSYAAKVALAPVLVSAVDEPSVFEVLLEAAAGVVSHTPSSRADGDAGRMF